MPQPATTIPETPPRRGIPLTREHYHTLADAGLLKGRFELIEGEIVPKMPQNPPHIYVLMALTDWLVGLFGRTFVRSQLPISVSSQDNQTNEPEPDAAVTMQPFTAYPDRLPGPDDLLFVAEVSDTTLRDDLTVKAALYARAGIPEYWVLDIAGRRLLAHRQPVEGRYQALLTLNADESVATLARPGIPVRVGDLLSPVA